VIPLAEKRFLCISATYLNNLKTNTMVFILFAFASKKFLSGGCA